MAKVQKTNQQNVTLRSVVAGKSLPPKKTKALSASKVKKTKAQVKPELKKAVNPKGFQKGNPYSKKGCGGRPPGVLNKVHRSVKEAMVEAFDNLGGVASLVRWARLNPTDFYRLWARLLPIQVTGDGGGPVVIEHKYDLKRLSASELAEMEKMVEKIRLDKEKVVEGEVVKEP